MGFLWLFMPRTAFFFGFEDNYRLGGLFSIIQVKEIFSCGDLLYIAPLHRQVNIGRKKHLCFFLPDFYCMRQLRIPERLVNSVAWFLLWQTLQSVAGVLALRYGFNLRLQLYVMDVRQGNPYDRLKQVNPKPIRAGVHTASFGGKGASLMPFSVERGLPFLRFLNQP